jgi:transposase
LIIFPLVTDLGFSTVPSHKSNKKVFTESEIKQLAANPHVQSVTKNAITYAPSFKLSAVTAYLQGQAPQSIFIEAGFDLSIIDPRKPRKCLQRWRKTFAKEGEAGLIEERRGKASTGRIAYDMLSLEEKLKRAETKIKYLELENDFLKKLEELERQAKRRQK